MNYTVILAVLLVLGIVGFLMGHRRSVAVAGGRLRDLHSLPSYYGFYVSIWAVLPALLLFAVWVSAQGWIVDRLVLSAADESIRALPADRLSLKMSDIRGLAAGTVTSATPDEATRQAAAHYARLASLSKIVLAGVMLILVAADVGDRAHPRICHPAYLHLRLSLSSTALPPCLRPSWHGWHGVLDNPPTDLVGWQL